MKLEVLRISSEADSTSGLLFDVTYFRKFLCYTLEDEYREEKIKGETRIPAGTYQVVLRKSGGFHNKYVKRYGEMHLVCFILLMYLTLSIFLFILVTLMSTLQGVYYWAIRKRTTKLVKMDSLGARDRRISEFIRR